MQTHLKYQVLIDQFNKPDITEKWYTIDELMKLRDDADMYGTKTQTGKYQINCCIGEVRYIINLDQSKPIK